jgi:hypothetical protein
MTKARSQVGLDVHATKIVAAVLDVETGELQTFAMSGDAAGAAGFCAGLPRPARVAYEAGPTGYGLARELTKRGVECVVAAPSKIPRASGDRVKTDRRDAELLARLLMAGKLHAVRVPGDEEEALRDLVRAREAVRVDLMRCRHRLSKLLLRHGIRFEDGAAWTQRHRDWLRARPPAAGRGGLALPCPTERRPRTYRPPRRPTLGGDRGRLVSSAAATSHLDTTGSTRQAPHDHRGRCRARAERLLLGGHPNRVKSPAAHNFIPSAGSVAARQRAGNPRLAYEQPALTGWPRPILDSGSPRRTMVLRNPNPRISV